MHPQDIEQRGLDPEQIVSVKSSTGIMHGIRVTAFPKIRPGNVAMYYPECNVLVPRISDPRSRTPSFKSIPVRVLSTSLHGSPVIV
jgi:anaerobic selenocysteine-containing dehydrogenase